MKFHYLLMLSLVIGCVDRTRSQQAAASSSVDPVSETCQHQLDSCMERLGEETKVRLSLASGCPTSLPSAPVAAPPVAAVAWAPVEDPASLVGTWVDADGGDAMPSPGKLQAGGVRIIIKKNPKKSKTPYSLKFWAPSEGHMAGKTVSGGCGFYTDLHGEPEGTIPWRSAYCAGFGKATEGIAIKLRLERDGKRLKVDLDNWLTSTMVAK